MAFFDNIGKKITEVSQTAVQKTKDVADIAKFNSEISALEKNINNLYYQIGKLYVAKHSADCEEDFSGLIRSIKENEGKISNLKECIQDIKGMVHCEKCGAAVPTGTSFCSSCGAPMAKAAPSNENTERCPSCNATIPQGVRFCTSCGKPIMRDAAPAQPAAKTCPGCGTPVDPESAFCTECGYKF